MTEMDRIMDQHTKAFNGDPWYGFPLMRILSGLTAEKAASRPIPKVHSIFEIVLHIAAWEGAVLERLLSGSVSLPSEGDWPPITSTGEDSWQRAQDHLRDTHEKLSKTLGTLNPERLDEMLGAERDLSSGGGHTVGSTLHGIIQHNVYHSGQISILRKALE
jgi:uncharacterized damage-inducible protein DinB